MSTWRTINAGFSSLPDNSLLAEGQTRDSQLGMSSGMQASGAPPLLPCRPPPLCWPKWHPGVTLVTAAVQCWQDDTGGPSRSPACSPAPIPSLLPAADDMPLLCR